MTNGFTNDTKMPHGCFSEHFELQFYKIFRTLKSLGCDYLYFLGKDTHNSFRFCTDETWMNMYHEEQFIQNDPLKRIAEYKKSVVLPWDQVTHLDGKERRTMEGRNSFGLHHGLTISQHKNERSFTFVFATETKEHLLAQYILQEKSEHLKTTIKDLVSIFDHHILLSKQIILPIM